jgi:hypothetical protein
MPQTASGYASARCATGATSVKRTRDSSRTLVPNSRSVVKLGSLLTVRKASRASCCLAVSLSSKSFVECSMGFGSWRSFQTFWAFRCSPECGRSIALATVISLVTFLARTPQSWAPELSRSLCLSLALSLSSGIDTTRRSS